MTVYCSTIPPQPDEKSLAGEPLRSVMPSYRGQFNRMRGVVHRRNCDVLMWQMIVEALSICARLAKMLLVAYRAPITDYRSPITGLRTVINRLNTPLLRQPLATG
ncbi:hypothetical protein OAM23_02615 [Luminiphilus sp.]|jgi:hypothetical protein|nr:hypothetical protein [Luminiphilus sp.]